MAMGYTNCGRCKVKLNGRLCSIKEYDIVPTTNIGKCFLWLKHKITYERGKGYICKRCGKPLSQCH